MSWHFCSLLPHLLLVAVWYGWEEGDPFLVAPLAQQGKSGACLQSSELCGRCLEFWFLSHITWGTGGNVGLVWVLCWRSLEAVVGAESCKKTSELQTQLKL